MTALRTLLCTVIAAAPALWLPATAQVTTTTPLKQQPAYADPPRGAWLPGGRSYLGLQPSRSRLDISCGTSTLICSDKDVPAQLYAGTMVGKFWGVEMGYLNMGRQPGAGAERRAQGLNLSLVGNAPVVPSLRVFGKVGTTYGPTDTSPAAAYSIAAGSDGFGLSFGGGLSFDFTRRLSATVEWESNDFRFAGSGRDPVRSTSLGLQYRY
jgi:OmpA-OmpF porin, OOP family